MLTKVEKMETFGYYLDATQCVCGRPKEKKHWCCESCKAQHWRSPIALDLARACTEHVRAARALLDLCKCNTLPPSERDVTP